jgi:hypothetical protein
MTSSPCKKCPKRHKSKYECVKDCEMIKAVQDAQICRSDSLVMSAIDYSEEGRFSVNYSSAHVLP